MEGNRGIGSSSERKIMAPCDVEALKKCLEENNGDQRKCRPHIEAFKNSIKKPSPSSDSP